MKGRKRHLVVDVLGLVLSCFVSAANVADIKAASVLLIPAWEANSVIEEILADRSYEGNLGSRIQIISEWVLEIGQRLGKDFVVEPWRWVVERTFP